MSVSHNYITLDEPNIGTFAEGRPSTKFWDYQEIHCSENDRDLMVNGMASVSVKDLYMPNMSMRHMEGRYNRDACLVNKNDVSADLPGSCIFLKGSVMSHPKSNKAMVRESGQGRQNFLYDPYNEFHHWIPANTQIEFLHFSIEQEHLINLLPNDEKWSEELRNKIAKKQWIMGDKASYITIEQSRILHNILNCPMTGRMHEIMLETSTTQLILLQLWSLFHKEISDAPTDGLTKRDHDLAQEIREFLFQTFLSEHSLDCLSKHFALNTNKLMAVFRKAFGQSIFDYLTELKMNHAFQLIQREDKRVIDVARVLGYKNANHFSAAFKKRFGISPTEVR